MDGEIEGIVRDVRHELGPALHRYYSLQSSFYARKHAFLPLRLKALRLEVLRLEEREMKGKMKQRKEMRRKLQEMRECEERILRLE